MMNLELRSWVGATEEKKTTQEPIFFQQGGGEEIGGLTLYLRKRALTTGPGTSRNIGPVRTTKSLIEKGISRGGGARYL